MTSGTMMVDLASEARRIGVAFGARIVHQPRSVFEQLGITFTREEWAAFNMEAGTDYPYPFADVVALRPTPSKEQ